MIDSDSEKESNEISTEVREQTRVRKKIDRILRPPNTTTSHNSNSNKKSSWP